MSGHDSDLLRHALQTAQRNGFRFVRVKNDEQTFRAVFNEIDEIEDDSPTMALAEFGESAPREEFITIKATSVGYFEPAKDLPNVGEKVESGAGIGVITALGIRNDVTAKRGGELVEVLVKPNEPVEYGQALLRLKQS